MKQAMRARDSARLGAIRLLLAAIKQREVDERVVLSDENIVEIIVKMLKQRRDSIAAFEVAQRQDLVAQEQFELDILQSYLPQALSIEEIHSIIHDAITKTQAVDIKDMSKVMAHIKPVLIGRVDMNAVSALVKELLA